MSMNFSFKDSRQERIYRRLHLVGPGPATFYKDACSLMAMEPMLDTTTHLVGHLIREIESAIRAVLEPAVGQSDQKQAIETEPNTGHRRKILAILAGLNIKGDDSVAVAWLRLADKAEDYALSKLAHRNALARPRQVDDGFRSFWNEMELIIDLVLEKFETHYLEAHKLIDQLLSVKSPSRDDANKLKNKVPNNLVSLEYFFNKIDSSWLQNLRDEGFFTQPIEPEYNSEAGGFSLPVWPESRYLVRMASTNPEVVADIAAKIPDTTNGRIHSDLIDIALALPPDLSIQIVKKARLWLENRFQLLFPEKLGALMVHLATGGKTKEAIALAYDVLALSPEQNDMDKEKQDQAFSPSPEPKAYFNIWHYEQILDNYLPRFVELIGIEALILLCELLNTAICLTRRDKSANENEDFSFIWKGSIDEQHEENSHDFKELLISSIRDAAEHLMISNREEVIRLIDEQSFKVYKRLSLHLRRKWPEIDMEGTSRLISDYSVFNDYYLEVELRKLLHEIFNIMPEEVQQTYLAFIDKGPDYQKWADQVEARKGGKPNEDQINRFIRHWQYRKLYPIQEFLEGRYQRQYEKFVEEFGAIDETELRPYRMKVISGVTSPKSTTELRSLSIDEFIDFLSSWEPAESWEGPSKEGLCQNIKQIVLSDPNKFVPESERFQGLDPDYISAIIAGVEQAIMQGNAISWEHILNLCLWVVKQSNSRSSIKDSSKEVDEWRSTRSNIIGLISQGLSLRTHGIPYDMRAIVWDVLEPLSTDPEPTVEYESTYGGSNMDPTSLSINTIRGKAIHAVILYAIWVIRKEKEKSADKTLGLDEMPEVRNVLDFHLNTDYEKTLSIRSIYGEKFPALMAIDSQWASNNVIKIFPTDADLQELRNSAWDAYVNYGRFSLNVFELLREEYSLSIEQIGSPSDDASQLSNPKHQLAKHLMTLYWHDRLNFKEPGNFLERFFNNASDSVRSEAIRFIGSSLNEAERKVAPEIINRLKALWNHRMEVAVGKPIASSLEISQFGWWFISEQIDDLWSITQLIEVLKLTGEIEPDHLVIERLAVLSKTMSKDSLEALSLMIEGDREGWRIYGWREQARSIITDTLQDKAITTQEAARALVNKLCAHGFLDYGDLL